MMASDRTEYYRLLYLAFPARGRKVKAQIKAWADNHRDQRLESMRRYRRKHPNQDRLYKQAHKIESCYYSKQWQKRNPEKVAALVAARRAKVRGATIGNMAAIAKIYTRAKELRRWFDVAVDHVIPLVKGGTHTPENLQIIYRTENEAKGSRVDYIPTIVFT